VIKTTKDFQDFLVNAMKEWEAQQTQRYGQKPEGEPATQGYGPPPAQPSTLERVIVEGDTLVENLEHSIHHLEQAAEEMGPVDKVQFINAHDELSKKICKVVLNYDIPGGVVDKSNYVAAIRLGALFNAIERITILLCAEETGGPEGEAAKNLVYSALSGQ
jgi:hypothetical protein